MNMKKFILLLSLCLLCGMPGCRQKNQVKSHKKQHKLVITATLQQRTSWLYFTGKLQPIALTPVPAPVNGQVSQLFFRYGESVTKGQSLITINSRSMAMDFRKVVNEYLQKKEAYEDGIQTFQGNKMLYKAGVISRNEFVLSKTQFENTVIDYSQALLTLREVLHKAHMNSAMIEQLTLKDTQKVTALLKKTFTHFMVKSPKAGVVLFPSPAQENVSSDKSPSTTLTVGATLKSGQVMLYIGDFTGLATRIAVSEMDINRINVGMPAVITGEAFPGIILHGIVVATAAQASPGDSGSSQSNLSEFRVWVHVLKLTPSERQQIHVGMTAKIAIAIHEKTAILLPLAAINHNNMQPIVTVLDKSGRRRQVPVVLGRTTPQGNVAVLHGVSAGQRVIMPAMH